jgi:hypothetical protein
MLNVHDSEPQVTTGRTNVRYICNLLFLDMWLLLTLRLLMSYIYGAPMLDVSRSHTTTQHSR